jgi:hypothetical protein
LVKIRNINRISPQKSKIGKHHYQFIAIAPAVIEIPMTDNSDLVDENQISSMQKIKNYCL